MSTPKSKRSDVRQVRKDHTSVNAADDSDYSSISSLASLSSSDSSLDAETFLKRIRDKTRLKAKIVSKTNKSPCCSSPTSVSSSSTEADFQMALKNLLKSSVKSVDPDAKGAIQHSVMKNGIFESLEQVNAEMTECESQYVIPEAATEEQFGKSKKEEGDCLQETSTSNPLLGFSTGSNGEVSFGAFIRLPQDSPQYLKSFCQRAERPLKGLQ
ncbi:unnamed protein product [Schistocephalus solidus]|uniref:Protein CUSTOS n=1 Tax=Schistocephalus solidus TaxID=70667 RepID=A0A183SMA2_SCHSO|nr:unnamed protein product [Schistocephalus solidus]